MKLSKNWVPHNIHVRKILLNNLEFYSLAVLGGNAAAEPAIPDKIWGPIAWRMPLRDAMKLLPAGARRHREMRMANLAFPRDSLHITTMAMDGRVVFEDHCNRFKYLSFICDTESCVIGIQLVETSPKTVNWPSPGPNGILEPYYNYIEDRYNGSSGNCVPYQIVDAGRGVKMIKTVLFNQPQMFLPHGPGECPGTVSLQAYASRPYLENVHWYLTAPLAKSLLEIVASVRKSGLDDQ
ncbi:hypothetical protein WJU23_17865 [Prosthecobacter sp. SYSU 5D2]|uniref:hypothetical protein n=1 Tax=Prosthecobacter sp. SYSU 5D2 TaxID=3134134 RepID=UPI0031FE993A